MLAVGTPARRGDGLADVSFVMEAAGEVAAWLRDDGVVVTKSTVPVGTGDAVEALIRERRPDMKFRSPPIRSSARRRGDRGLQHPDRIIVGVEDERARAAMSELYRRCSSTRRRSCSPAAARPS